MIAESAGEPAVFPPSFSQELLWLLDRAAPGNASYNVPRSRRIAGPLDVAALRRTFDAMIARHEVLRTTYGFHDDSAVQIIHPPRPADFQETDLRHLPAAHREVEVARLAREAAARVFDLAVDFPLRIALWRLGDEEHVLLIMSHHICCDGWSREIMLGELRECYEAFAAGNEPGLPPLPIQYADYAIWQRKALSGERLDALVNYWRHELGDADFVLELPTDFPRPPRPGSSGYLTSIRLGAEQVRALAELGQSVKATMYMVLLAAYQTVLHRLTGASDVLVGSPIAGRLQPETEGLIGYFANTIIQRGRFARDPSFLELLSQVRSSTLDAYDHQEVPFEKLVLELQGAQHLTYSPIFQVVLTQLEHHSETLASLGAATVDPYGLERNETKFDLTLFMSEQPDGSLELSLRGRTDLFRPETVDRLLTRIDGVLQAVVGDPTIPVSQLPLLLPDEQLKLSAANATDLEEGEPATVVSLFEAQSVRVPDRIAVIGPRQHGNQVGETTRISLSYRDLSARASQLAHQLQSLGVGDGATVALLLDHSVEALVGILGTLFAGASYVPISPTLPPARRTTLLAESRPTAIVSIAGAVHDFTPVAPVVTLDLDTSVQGEIAERTLAATATPDALAYVLFTSGSTGVPKGVAVTHSNIVHYARAVSRVLTDMAGRNQEGFAGLDGLQFGMASTVGADLGNTSLFLSLFAGGTLHILGERVMTEPAGFSEYLRSNPLDVLKITPNHLRSLVAGRTGRDLAAVLPRRWLVLGGEALSLELARELVAARTCRILNHYGPTETTVGVSTFEVTEESLDQAAALGATTVPIGRPLANTRLFVVQRNELVPPGVAGELLVGGLGVSKGYLNRPDQSAERFFTFAGERVYRTGDRVRRLSDGNLEFLGRLDDQVKVRGYRVELGEIEQLLRVHPGIAQAVVSVLPGSHEPTLVAYVVARQSGYAVSHGDRPTSERLTEWLATQLPAHMVPSAIVLLDHLPLNANGKVDRAKLPRPSTPDQTQTERYLAPRPGTEAQLAKIWTEVLKRDRIGANDDFLALGGHSLLAIRVLGRISRSFGVRLPIRVLFEAPTIQRLAQRVDQEARLTAIQAMDDAEAERLLETTESKDLPSRQPADP